MICAIGFPIAFPVYLVFSFIIVAFEKSGRYIESAGVTVIAVLVLMYALVLPGRGSIFTPKAATTAESTPPVAAPEPAS